MLHYNLQSFPTACYPPVAAVQYISHQILGNTLQARNQVEYETNPEENQH